VFINMMVDIFNPITSNKIHRAITKATVSKKKKTNNDLNFSDIKSGLKLEWLQEPTCYWSNRYWVLHFNRVIYPKTYKRSRPINYARDSAVVRDYIVDVLISNGCTYDDILEFFNWLSNEKMRAIYEKDEDFDLYRASRFVNEFISKCIDGGEEWKRKNNIKPILITKKISLRTVLSAHENDVGGLIVQLGIPVTYSWLSSKYGEDKAGDIVKGTFVKIAKRFKQKGSDIHAIHEVARNSQAWEPYPFDTLDWRKKFNLIWSVNKTKNQPWWTNSPILDKKAYPIIKKIFKNK